MGDLVANLHLWNSPLPALRRHGAFWGHLGACLPYSEATMGIRRPGPPEVSVFHCTPGDPAKPPKPMPPIVDVAPQAGVGGTPPHNGTVVHGDWRGGPESRGRAGPGSPPWFSFHPARRLRAHTHSDQEGRGSRPVGAETLPTPCGAWAWLPPLMQPLSAGHPAQAERQVPEQGVEKEVRDPV